MTTDSWHERVRGLRSDLSMPPSAERLRRCLAHARSLLEEFSFWREITQKRRLELGALHEDAFVRAAFEAQRLLAILQSDLKSAMADFRGMPAKRDRALRTLAEAARAITYAEAAADTLTTGQEEAKAFLAQAGLSREEIRALLPHALTAPRPLLLLRNRLADPTTARIPLRDTILRNREKSISNDEWTARLRLWAEALSGPLAPAETFLIHDALPGLLACISANRIKAILALMPSALALGIALHRAQQLIMPGMHLDIALYTPKDITHHNIAGHARHVGETHPRLRQIIGNGGAVLILDRVAEHNRFAAVEAVLAQLGHGVFLRGALLASSKERHGLAYCHHSLPRILPKALGLPEPPLSTTVSDVHKAQPRLADQMLAIAQLLRG